MIAPHGNVRRRRRGLTLVETTATIVVLGLVGGAMSGILFTAADGYFSASTRTQLHTELSTALDRCVRELRAVDQDGFTAGLAPDIDDVEDDSIAWEGNNSISLDGSDLELTINGRSGVLLSDVSAFTVAAHDDSGVALALPLTAGGCDPIRRVVMTVELTRHGVTEALGTRVFLRSMSSQVSGGS